MKKEHPIYPKLRAFWNRHPFVWIVVVSVMFIPILIFFLCVTMIDATLRALGEFCRVVAYNWTLYVTMVKKVAAGRRPLFKKKDSTDDD
jgi:hypothetical protein